MTGTNDFLLKLSDAVQSTVERAAPSVVAVHAGDRSPSSGFLLQPGVVVTAEERIEQEDGIEITLADGKRIAATLAGRDPSTDIAILRFAGATPSDALASAPDVRTGAIVIAVGRNGPDAVATLGTVAQAGPAWRSSQGGLIDASLRIDVSLPRVSEGGALVDAAGRLVGMPVFGPRRRVLAIPASTIARVAQQILTKGSIARGYVGVGLQPVRPGEGADAGRAAMVVSIDPDGPAKRAGLLLGDILTGWNGEPVSGPRSLVDRLGPESVGTKVEIEIVRAGNPLKVSLTVAERPKA